MPAKKQKLIKPPVVFNLPGHDVDVKLQVFNDLEFHVHSTILKIHSAFFRKFLDSPDKEGKGENAGKFKYVWVTMIDDDGSWSLVDSRNYSVCILIYLYINIADFFYGSIAPAIWTQSWESSKARNGCMKTSFLSLLEFSMEKSGQSMMMRIYWQSPS